MNLAELSPAVPAISAEQLRHARTEAARTQRPLVEVLEEQLGLPREQYVAALAGLFHYTALDLADLNRLTPDFGALDYAEAVKRECLPVRDAAGTLLLVVGDPFSSAIQAWSEERLAQPFAWALAHRTDLLAFFARYEDSLRAMDGLLPAPEETRAPSAEAIADLSLRTINADTSPVVKLVHSTIYDALKTEASDIHIETGPGGLAIKYRIDGVLSSVGAVDGVELAEQVISRVKIMSELDIAERRIPQDGRFKVSVKGHEIDFRVSVMPSIFGEDAVLRILDKQALTHQLQGLTLDNLGFDAASVAQLRRMAREPYGMLLVTGPTGSGKTTTLYATITEIHDGLHKIVTIEDPVEYRLPGVLQIPVNEKKGLSFARGLRSILRHDPDRIMVGEIRDPETAQIAVQSALTGHLVFTTVHANNVFDVIGRFLHMGVDSYSFVSALNGVLAQRLVRRNCPHCTQPIRPEAQALADSGIAPEQAEDYRFRAGTGCGQCRGTGYKGRTAIAELLNLNDELRELIVARQPLRLIREAAQRHGTRYLREAALGLVRNGETTLAEINRVTFVA